jgi:hypothetical protein
VKRILIILMSLCSAINAGQLAIQKFPFHYKLSSKEFNADIPNYMVSKQVRSMDPDKLAAVLNSGNAYLDINECSDGQYSMDIKGRVKGGGLVGGLAAYVIVKVAPLIVIVPTAAFLYTGKAIAHVKGGPAMGDAYQKTVIDPLMPKVIDYSLNCADTIAPYVAAATGVASPV